MKVIVPGGMMRWAAVVLCLLVIVVAVYSILPRAGASAHVDFTSPENRTASGRSSHSGAIALASPGRIEGRSELVNVGAAIDGVVRAIHVKEGQLVHRGDILAE